MGNVFGLDDDPTAPKTSGRKRSNTSMPTWGSRQNATGTRANSGLMSAEGTNPGPMKDHCAVLPPYSQSMFVLGGTTTSNITVPMNVEELVTTGLKCEWKRRTDVDNLLPTGYNELIYHTSIYHPPTHSVIVFGDVVSTTFDNNHTVAKFCLNTNKWSLLTFENHSKLRPFKLGCTPIYRPCTDCIILFNDTNDGIELNDIVELDMKRLTWSFLRFSSYFSLMDSSTKGIGGTWFHSAVYSPRLDSIIVFGGLDLAEFRTQDSTWRFQLGKKVCTRVVVENPQGAPGARYLHTAQIVNEYMYVFGGCHMVTDTNGAITRESLNELYQLDLVSMHWRKIDVVGQLPCPRINHQMQTYYHKNFVCMVVHGGQDQKQVLLDDTFRILIPRLKASETHGWNYYEVLLIQQKLQHCTDCEVLT